MTTNRYTHRPALDTPTPSDEALKAIAEAFDSFDLTLKRIAHRHNLLPIDAWGWAQTLICEHESHTWDPDLDVRVCDDCGAIEDR